MARLIYCLLFIVLMLIIPSHQNQRYGFQPKLLHANNDVAKATMIEPEALYSYVNGVRSKRDVKPTSTESTSKSSTSASATSSTPDKSKAKKLNVSSPLANDRANLTIQNTNNITTMVSFLQTIHDF